MKEGKNWNGNPSFLEVHFKSESFIIPPFFCQQLIQFPLSTCPTVSYMYQAYLFTQVYQAYTMILQQRQLSFHVSRLPSLINWRHLLYVPGFFPNTYQPFCISSRRDVSPCMATADLDNPCDVETRGDSRDLRMGMKGTERENKKTSTFHTPLQWHQITMETLALWSWTSKRPYLTYTA